MNGVFTFLGHQVTDSGVTNAMLPLYFELMTEYREEN